MDLKEVISSVSGGLLRREEKAGGMLAVKVATTSVAATVWKVSQGKVEVGQVVSADVSDESFEKLLLAADKAVSSALAGSQGEVDKVIFALPHHWVDGGKVVPEHLRELRRLCKELELSPLGFVSLVEALENYFKEVEGAPLTAILVGVDGAKSVLSMYRAGKDLGTVTLDLGEDTDQIASAIEKALKKFAESEVLPSRIILYDGKSDLAAVARKITAHPWTQRMAFLHFPKVEVVAAPDVVKAVAVAGGLTMGGRYEALSGKSGASDEVRPEPGKLVSMGEDEERPMENEETREGRELEDKHREELSEVSAEEAGFVTEGELSGIRVAVPEVNKTAMETSEQDGVGRLQEFPAAPAEEGKGEEQNGLSVLISGFVARGKGIVKSFGSWRTGLRKKPVALEQKGKDFPDRLGGVGGPRKMGALAAAVASLVLLGVGVAVYTLPKVTVRVVVATKPFDREMDLGVVTTGATSDKSIAGSFVDVTEVGTKKGVATGSKLVGTKAKGEVTIYSVSGGKTFTAGTTLASPDGLKFALDKDVAVASGDAITPATVMVEVAAADIGSSYNLQSGTRFSIGKFSSSEYLAKNESAFSGGSSHQATVVTKDDQNRLSATLSAELLDRAVADLTSKVGSGNKLLPNAVTASVEKKKFSKEVDAEAETVSLDLTMSFRGVVFSEGEVVGLFARNYASDVPAQYEMTEAGSRVEVKGAKTDKSGNTVLAVRTTSDLMPKIDTSQIAKNILGKSETAAIKYISAIPGVSEVNVDVKPKVFSPIIALRLPWRSANINVEVVR